MWRQLRGVMRRAEPRLLGVPREALVRVSGVLALRVVRRHRHRHVRRRRLMRRPEVRGGGAGEEVREGWQGCGLEGVVGGQCEVGAYGAVGEEHGAAVEVVEPVERRRRGLRRRRLSLRRPARGSRRRGVAGEWGRHGRSRMAPEVR
uniref:Uncharacterized protein n=1 Tax=Arundo donax TaxID=35708 RepID=A0A0A9C4H7_ARUDO